MSLGRALDTVYVADCNIFITGYPAHPADKHLATLWNSVSRLSVRETNVPVSEVKIS
jgi:hypothetical protein